MPLRTRLLLVLAVLGVVTVVANGFSFLMFARLADEAAKLSPQLDAMASSSRAWIIGVSLVASVVGLAAFVQLARMLLDLIGGEPQYVANAVRQIASGDLNVALELREGDNQSLCAAISGMQRNLHQMVGELRAAGQKLDQSIREIGGLSDELLGSCTLHGDAAEDSTSAIDSLSGTVGLVMENAENVARQVNVSIERTQSANESLSALIGEISTVEEAVGDIATTAGEFIESTKAIADMTGQVHDIADQTNLLALNAAIEAARAGEQGRGFAVVADEVRKLAEKSAAAAAEINQVTRAMTERSEGVEEAIQRGQTSLATSQEHLELVAVALGESNQAVQDTTSNTEQIMASIQQQNEARERIGGHVDKMASISAENCAALTRAAAAMKDLEGLSGRLNALAAKFNV
ncbi:MAG TPA: methyl-accepting chemotaxis protein [Rhodocyclaceae bacterium]